MNDFFLDIPLLTFTREREVGYLHPDSWLLTPDSN